MLTVSKDGLLFLGATKIGWRHGQRYTIKGGSKNRTNSPVCVGSPHVEQALMALSQRLQIRQSQALVMTPQLMQAIKLLQLSNLDLVAYVDAELERNPLLEPGNADGEAAPGANGAQAADKPAEAGETWNGSDGEPSGEAKVERAEDHIDDTSVPDDAA